MKTPIVLATLISSAVAFVPLLGHGAPPALAPARPVIAKVDAARASAGMPLSAGQKVILTATGTWSIDNRNLYGTFDASGTTTGKPTEACALVPSAKMGTLVGTLDGVTWVAVGAGPTTLAGPGTLQLAANDCTGGPGWPFFADNSGTLEVSVSALFEVAANQTGTPAVRLDRGAYEIMARGTWSVDSRDLYGTFNADGTTTGKPTEACALVPSAKMGTLVGTLDGTTWFAIGARSVIRGPGALQVAANDCTGGPGWPFFADNSGTLTVKLSPLAPEPKPAH